MSEKSIKKYLPSFITILMAIIERWKRQSVHNLEIKKIDQTREQLDTIENMLVRLEKKIQQNREMINSLKFILTLSIFANVVLLIALFLKIFAII